MNKIIIEGKEFDLPQELVDKIKKELASKSNIQIVKKLDYADIAKELFFNKPFYFYSSLTNKVSSQEEGTNEQHSLDLDNCTSKKQVEKLLAINKMMNVAKYLNGDWNFTKDTSNYRIIINTKNNNKLDITSNIIFIEASVYFKSRELAQQCINILGEDTIKLALCTDY